MVERAVSKSQGSRVVVLALILCLEAMDVSADLHELSRCQVGLVSAGVKSILDIGRYGLFKIIIICIF